MSKNLQVWLSIEEVEHLNRASYFAHMDSSDQKQSDFWMGIVHKLEKALEKAKSKGVKE